MSYSEYRDLGPIDNVENGDEYINALNWAFDNKKIKNIAITGPYGSGKSSVIDTFLKENEKIKGSQNSIRATSLKISLAAFPTESNKTNTGQTDVNNQIRADEIEKSILKQLFYKVEPRRIPKSRYRKLHSEKFSKDFTDIIVIFIAVMGFIMALENKEFIKVSKVNLIPLLVLLVVMIITAAAVTYLCRNVVPKFKIKEIKLLSKVSIGNGCGESDSAFNKNLDEIMYFFEKTGYRTVFFEDLDRWEEPQIFIHLRELNNLLNNDDSIKDKPIVFVYAVRDDIFMTSDRTKFFDFIIPVVPVVSSTNSGDTLLQRFNKAKEKGMGHQISDEFILDISPFISEMRVLQNIYNEFVVYKRTLTTSQGLNLSDEKMFAMIAFKNLYPKNFARIQDKDGILKTAFNDKRNCIEKKVDGIQLDIDKCFSQIEESKIETPNSLEEPSGDEIDILFENIDNLRNEQHRLLRMSFAELIKEYPTSDIFSNAVQSNEFLVFLLRRGYIDENYSNYINYFKGTSITPNDMNFVLSVRKHEPLEFSYPLSKTPMIAERYLLKFEFEEKAIYNFDLLEQLLESGTSEKLNIFIKQLSDGENISWQFIDEFIDRTQKQALFVKLLAESCSEFWAHISGDAELTYERQLMYLKMILSETEISTIQNLNADNCMTQYFEEHDDILQRVMACDQEKIVSVIESLNIHFRALNTENVPCKILDSVFDKCQYEINEVMIRNVIAYKNDTLLENFEREPYSAIIKLGYERLLQYAYNNISDYVDRIVLAQNSPSDESEDIVDMLIRLEGESELQIKLIEQERFRLESIKNCAYDKVSTDSDTWKPVWNALLDNDAIELCWENVQEYWKIYKLSETLAKYIERHTDDLATIDSSTVNDEFIKEFISAEFETEVVRKLLPILKLDNFDLDIQEIQETTLQIMIDCKYFEFTSERYVDVDIVSPEIGIDFIINNQEEYVQARGEVSMSSSLLEKLIFNDNFSRKNTELIFREYAENYMTSEIAIHMKSLNLPATKEILDAAWNCLDDEERKKLLLDYCTILDANKLESYFAKLGKPYSELSDRSHRHNVSLKLTEKNKVLSEHLKKIGYITSFEEKKDVLKLRVKQVK